MYERTRNLLLRLLKVPPEPHPPSGDPASVRVFRAGRNYFRLRLFTWSFAQTLALAGIIFWAVVLVQVESAARAQKQARAAQTAKPPPPPAEAVEPVALAPGTEAGPAAAASTPGADAGPAARAKTPAAAPGEKKARVPAWVRSLDEAVKAAKRRTPKSGWEGFKMFFVEVALLLPEWAFPVIWYLKILGFALYLAQIPITYAVRRLDYEMHWYVVTDRSLRLRTGVWNVQELTMSFANLQQVVVTQGPLQRLLGLGDVRVQSAGGSGGAEHSRQAQQNSLHAGHFHSVDNAIEIRDLILDRLRRFRETGLGDPDEVRRSHSRAPAGRISPSGTASESGLLAAAREFRDEARALRVALG